jgi:hypothetical protein
MPLDPYKLETNYPELLQGGVPRFLYEHAMQRASSADILGVNEHTFVGGRGVLDAQRRAALFRQQQMAMQQGAALQAESMANMMAGAKTMAGRPVTEADKRAFATTANFATRMLGPMAMQFAVGQRILDDLSPGRISPLNIAMATTTAGAVIRDPITGSQQLQPSTASGLSSAMFRAMVNNPTDATGRVLGPRQSYGQTGMQIGRNFAYMASQGLLGDTRLPASLATNAAVNRAVLSGGMDLAAAAPNASDMFSGALGGFWSQSQQQSLGASAAAIRSAGIDSPAAYEQFMQEARAAQISRQTEMNQAKATRSIASVTAMGDTVGRADLVAAPQTRFEELTSYERELRLLELAAVGAQDLAFTNPERAKELQETYQAYRDRDTSKIKSTAFQNMSPAEQLSFVTSIIPNLEEEDAVKIVERLSPSQINPLSPGAAPGLDMVKDAFGVTAQSELASKADKFAEDPRTKAMQQGLEQGLASAQANFNAKMSAIDGILKDSGMDEFLEDVEEKSKLLQTMMSGAGGQVSDARATEFLQTIRAAGRRSGLTATELSQAGMMGTSIVSAYGLDRDMSLLATNSLLQSSVALGRSGFQIDRYKTFGARSESELNTVNATITAGAIASREGNVLATVLRAAEGATELNLDGSDESNMFAAVRKRASGESLTETEQADVDRFLALSETEQLSIAGKVTGARSSRLSAMVDEEMANQELMSRMPGAARLADRGARVQSRGSDLKLDMYQRMQQVGMRDDSTNNDYFAEVGSELMMELFDTMTPGEYRDENVRDETFARGMLTRLATDARGGNAQAVAMAKQLGLDLTKEGDALLATDSYKAAVKQLTARSREVQFAGADSLADKQGLLGARAMTEQDNAASELAKEAALQFALSDMDRIESLPEVLAAVGKTGTSDKDLTLVSAASRVLGHDISGESQGILASANDRMLSAMQRRQALADGETPLEGTTKEKEELAIEQELTSAKADVRAVMASERDLERKRLEGDAAWASGQMAADAKASGSAGDEAGSSVLRSLNVATLNLNVNGGEVTVRGNNVKSSPEAPVP